MQCEIALTHWTWNFYSLKNNSFIQISLACVIFSCRVPRFFGYPPYYDFFRVIFSCHFFVSRFTIFWLPPILFFFRVIFLCHFFVSRFMIFRLSPILWFFFVSFFRVTFSCRVSRFSGYPPYLRPVLKETKFHFKNHLIIFLSIHNKVFLQNKSSQVEQKIPYNRLFMAKSHFRWASRKLKLILSDSTWNFKYIDVSRTF